ncbi:hypothetical protein K488DRAFT_74428 [Vararia minispora EC-137]|uniref:Uncharacterized protein n=1 Tax=Vararia minispora EC-137 TaxID=1314806 RepID=A0ACB8Q729_9AGAM|nr:hypothetical protein K488DRAFT_74428 [Vararia minispora EC-137]
MDLDVLCKFQARIKHNFASPGPYLPLVLLQDSALAPASPVPATSIPSFITHPPTSVTAFPAQSHQPSSLPSSDEGKLSLPNAPEAPHPTTPSPASTISLPTPPDVIPGYAVKIANTPAPHTAHRAPRTHHDKLRRKSISAEFMFEPSPPPQPPRVHNVVTDPYTTSPNQEDPVIALCRTHKCGVSPSTGRSKLPVGSDMYDYTSCVITFRPWMLSRLYIPAIAPFSLACISPVLCNAALAAPFDDCLWSHHRYHVRGVGNMPSNIYIYDGERGSGQDIELVIHNDENEGQRRDQDDSLRERVQAIHPCPTNSTLCLNQTALRATSAGGPLRFRAEEQSPSDTVSDDAPSDNVVEHPWLHGVFATMAADAPDASTNIPLGPALRAVSGPWRFIISPSEGVQNRHAVHPWYSVPSMNYPEDKTIYPLLPHEDTGLERLDAKAALQYFRKVQSNAQEKLSVTRQLLFFAESMHRLTAANLLSRAEWAVALLSHSCIEGARHAELEDLCLRQQVFILDPERGPEEDLVHYGSGLWDPRTAFSPISRLVTFTSGMHHLGAKLSVLYEFWATQTDGASPPLWKRLRNWRGGDIDQNALVEDLVRLSGPKICYMEAAYRSSARVQGVPRPLVSHQWRLQTAAAIFMSTEAPTGTASHPSNHHILSSIICGGCGVRHSPGAVLFALERAGLDLRFAWKGVGPSSICAGSDRVWLEWVDSGVYDINFHDGL